MTSKTTKRALISSALAIVLCLAMLIGTTFAWFTDTASTGVNKIQAGNLHVAIQDKAGSSIENLEWHAADNRAQDNILWEPGATYTLTPFKIANTGNLALKYKLVVTGLDGDAKLLKVIKFSYELGNAALDLNKEGHLAAGASTDMITVSATMDKAAGNEYMDKTLEGVTITVYATQDTVEYDSTDNQYDENATYPAVNQTELTALLNDGKVVALGKDIAPTETIIVSGENAKSTLDLNGKKMANDADIYSEEKYTWSLVSVRSGADLTITGNGTFAAKENDCFPVDVQDGSTVTIKNGTFIGNIDAVYVYEGTAIIEGGFFSVQQKYQQAGKENEFVLNCYDANYKNGTAKITVTGGTFVNFNPADCQAEGAHTNFVADGYKVVSETQANGDIWYTVVPE